MSNTKFKKYKIEGRIRADIWLEETVEAKNEDQAVREFEIKAHRKIDRICRSYEISDNEIYAEEIK